MADAITPAQDAKRAQARQAINAALVACAARGEDPYQCLRRVSEAFTGPAADTIETPTPDQSPSVLYTVVIAALGTAGGALLFGWVSNYVERRNSR